VLAGCGRCQEVRICGKLDEPLLDRWLADIVDEGQANGEIATQGRPEKVRSADLSPESAPAPLPVPKQRLAECRQIRDTFTEDELEERFAAATEHGKELPTKAEASQHPAALTGPRGARASRASWRGRALRSPGW
jgi:hypothetical protein